MSEETRQKYNIPAEFKRLELPTEKRVLQEIKKEIEEKTLIKTFLVWHGILLKDFDIYQMCLENDISFNVRQARYPNKYVAKSQICKKHMEELPYVSEIYKKYLIGTRFQAEKELGKIATKKASLKDTSSAYIYDDSAMKTRTRLAKEYHVSEQTIYKYGVATTALNLIADISLDTFYRILREDIKVSVKTLESIVNMGPAALKNAVATLSRSREGETFSQVRRELAEAEEALAEDTYQEQTPVTYDETMASVKDIPKYDPEREIKGLTFTIPSWRSTMLRVRKSSRLELISDAMKSKIRKELLGFIGESVEMLKEMEENNG